MSQVKNELIESLFNAGKISFQEALTLASREEAKPEPSMYEGAWLARKTTIDMNKNTFVNSLIEPQYENEDGKQVLVSFDLNKCVELMKWLGVQWINTNTGQMEDVTVDKLKEVLKKNAMDAVNGLLEQEENGKESWPVSSHGFTATAYFDDDEHKKICLEIEYIPMSAANWIEKSSIS